MRDPQLSNDVFPATAQPCAERKRPLPRRFSELVLAVVIGAMIIYASWSLFDQDRSVEDKALTEARALNREAQATWSYIGGIQDQINYDTDGTYNFKGVYCAAAAKSIADQFTALSDGYAVRYARTNPRAVEDTPDAFEERAIAHLEHGRSEFYEITDYQGVPSLRYAARIGIEEECLSCHGSPRGSLDEMGYYREGMAVGDLAGIASIVVPIEDYQHEAMMRMAGTLLLFLALLVVMILLIRRGLRQWVTEPMAQANAQLVKANADLEEASRLREEFLATISHELRTPLSSIIAFTDLWRGRSEADEGSRELVEQVGQNSKVLLNMVNNMIDTARIEAGKYRIVCEDIDLVDEVCDLRAMAGPLAARKNIVFSAEVAPTVPIMQSDWNAIHTILANLISNALSFTESGGQVSLGIRYDRESETIVAEVADTGCGIAPDDLERIFQKFERPGIEKRTDTVGSGLGLGLARNLARMLGGDVAVKSTVNIGSTFTLTLPLRGKDSYEDSHSR